MNRTALTLAAAGLLSLALSGCVVAPVGPGYYHRSYVEPAYDSTYVEVIPPRPVYGYVWFGGRWDHDDRGHRSWSPGRWDAPGGHHDRR